MKFTAICLLYSTSFFVESLAQAKPISKADFRVLLNKLARGWNEGNARMAADCFTENAIYSEPPDKQLYKGREALFGFFGGAEGRAESMDMQWHHLVYDEETGIGAGEWTFKFAGSISHGVVMIKIENGLISHWREYYYESPLGWEDFMGENRF